jgi:hypothetical protein
MCRPAGAALIRKRTSGQKRSFSRPRGAQTDACGQLNDSLKTDHIAVWRKLKAQNKAAKEVEHACDGGGCWTACLLVICVRP